MTAHSANTKGPTRLARGMTLVVASHNEGKVREIRTLLEPFGLKTLSAGELNLPEPEETGKTFAANAQLKAVAAATASGFMALADDSGLAVDALDGAPGIYSARWAIPEDTSGPRDFDLAMARVEQKLKDKNAVTQNERAAQFICSLSLASPDGQTQTFEGTVEGTLIWPPRGNEGFGYDPVFLPTGQTQTFGQMDPAQKHAMSHRADAFEKLITHLANNQTDETEIP